MMCVNLLSGIEIPKELGHGWHFKQFNDLVMYFLLIGES